jgi:HEAT repeat protein
MGLFDTLVYLSVYLTLAILLLSALAVMAHARSEVKEKEIHIKREQVQRILLAFLGGSADQETTIGKLREQETGIVEGVLLQTIGDSDPKARPPLQQLAQAMGLVQKELTALADRSWAIRLQAATRLGYLGSQEPIESLVAALQDEMLDVRMAAAHSLARLQAAEAVVPILQELSLPARWPLRRVAECLAEMGAAAVAPLLIYLDSPDITDAGRAAAIRALGILKAEETGPVLLRHLGHADPEIRIQSAKALGELGAAEAVAALLSAMDDEVWEVRSAAAQALGRLGDIKVIPRLIKGLSDSAWWVRFNSADGLYRLGSKGVEALRSMFGSEDQFACEISRQVLEEHGLFVAEQGAES